MLSSGFTIGYNDLTLLRFLHCECTHTPVDEPSHLSRPRPPPPRGLYLFPAYLLLLTNCTLLELILYSSFPPFTCNLRFVRPGIVGYCFKDEGRSHSRTSANGVSRVEINVTLSEYRALQRAVVSEHRTEVRKKNFWEILRRFRREHLRGISVYPVQVMTWYIQDGEGMPSHTRICPTSSYPVEAARAEAYYTAPTAPSLFTREHAYLLFFSGGLGGRVSSSFEMWDYQDREFSNLSVDQAKVCSHDRLELEGTMDITREEVVRELAQSCAAPPGVVRFLVAADSDASHYDVGRGTDSDTSSAPPLPTALRHWNRLGRTHADSSQRGRTLASSSTRSASNEGALHPATS